jgi:hypothetical protein
VNTITELHDRLTGAREQAAVAELDLKRLEIRLLDATRERDQLEKEYKGAVIQFVGERKPEVVYHMYSAKRAAVEVLEVVAKVCPEPLSVPWWEPVLPGFEVFLPVAQKLQALLNKLSQSTEAEAGSEQADLEALLNDTAASQAATLRSRSRADIERTCALFTSVVRLIENVSVSVERGIGRYALKLDRIEELGRQRQRDLERLGYR